MEGNIFSLKKGIHQQRERRGWSIFQSGRSVEAPVERTCRQRCWCSALRTVRGTDRGTGAETRGPRPAGRKQAFTQSELICVGSDSVQHSVARAGCRVSALKSAAGLSTLVTQKRSLNKDSSHHSAEVCAVSVSRATEERGRPRSQRLRVRSQEGWHLKPLRFTEFICRFKT